MELASEVASSELALSEPVSWGPASEVGLWEPGVAVAVGNTRPVKEGNILSKGDNIHPQQGQGQGAVVAVLVVGLGVVVVGDY